MTIPADLQPFQYCKLLEGKHPYHCPLKTPTSPPPFNTSNVVSTSTQPEIKVKIIYNGYGEYTHWNIFYVGHLPPQKYYGRPKKIDMQNKPTMQCKKTTFHQWVPLDEESLETNVTSWLYREENEAPTDFPKEMCPKESTIVEKMGYKAHFLGPKEQGRKESI